MDDHSYVMICKLTYLFPKILGLRTQRTILVKSTSLPVSSSKSDRTDSIPSSLLADCSWSLRGKLASRPLRNIGFKGIL